MSKSEVSLLKKKELLNLLLQIEGDDEEVIIDTGRYSDSNWKYAEDVDYSYVNNERVIVIR